MPAQSSHGAMTRDTETTPDGATDNFGKTIALTNSLTNLPEPLRVPFLPPDDCPRTHRRLESLSSSR